MAAIPPGPWHVNPNAWGKVVLGDFELPGLCTFEPTRSNKWDTKKTKAKHGGKREFAGVDLGVVKIECRIWTADQWQEWIDTGFPLLEPGPKDPSVKDPFKVQHAIASARKFVAITIDSISGPIRDGGFGVIEIDATEYREPDPTNASGTAGLGGNCSALAAQRELLRSQLLVYQSLISAYMNPSSTSFDLVKGAETANQIASLEIQINNIGITMQANGCGNHMRPSSGDPDDQAVAEKYLENP